MNIDDRFSQLVVLDGNESVLLIDMSIGNTCNYRCSYCHPFNYSGGWADHTKLLNLVDAIIQNTKDKTTRVYNLFGGEPAIMPNLDEFIKHIKENDPASHIRMTTNGSRTTRFWEQLSYNVDEVDFSIHVAHCDLELILKNSLACANNGVMVYISVLMDIAHWDAAVAACDFLTLHGAACGIFAKPVQIILGSDALQDYSLDQRRWIDNWNTFNVEKTKNRWTAASDNRRSTNPIRFKFYDPVASEYIDPITIDNIINLQLNDFQNWECWINIDKLQISADGNVTGGSCSISKRFGNYNLSDPFSWDWSREPMLCTLAKCANSCDIMSRKFMNKSDSIQAYDLFKSNQTAPILHTLDRVFSNLSRDNQYILSDTTKKAPGT